MHVESSPCPSCLSTDVAAVRDSSDLVGLYVTRHNTTLTLLPTHFTHPFSPVALAATDDVFTEFHHGLDPVVQVPEVGRHSCLHLGCHFNFIHHNWCHRSPCSWNSSATARKEFKFF